MVLRRLTHALPVWALAAACIAATPVSARTAASIPSPIQAKVMIVSMYGDEGKVWINRLGPWREVRVDGLSPEFPLVRCNQQGVCVMTTGMGHANAAASMMALTFSNRFDLRHTYFMIAGVAGIDPARGTLGTAAWANYLVDFGIQWEIDARELPPGWKTGYLGIFSKSPEEKPELEYRTEVFQLNGDLANAAFALSRNVTLADAQQAQTTRAKYDYTPANQPPVVTQCDTLTADTWWSGTALGERARDWTRMLTDGKGTYCTTQQEDNATYEALKRAASVHRVDLNRVVVLRTGADFDRPPKGMSSAENLLSTNDHGGLPIALENLYRAGNPLVQAIVTQWSEWRRGVVQK